MGLGHDVDQKSLICKEMHWDFGTGGLWNVNGDGDLMTWDLAMTRRACAKKYTPTLGLWDWDFGGDLVACWDFGTGDLGDFGNVNGDMVTGDLGLVQRNTLLLWPNGDFGTLGLGTWDWGLGVLWNVKGEHGDLVTWDLAMTRRVCAQKYTPTIETLGLWDWDL